MDRRRFLGLTAGGLAAGPWVRGQEGDAPAGEPARDAFPSPYAARRERRGGLEIRVGSPRVVMRGPMFPNLARFGDGSIILFAQAVEEGGPLTAIRSEDSGWSWRPHTAGVDGMGLNTFHPSSGCAVSVHYETKPIPGSAGLRSTRRWESDDAWHTLHGPLEDGTLWLPEDQFKAEEKQWFHGNIIELPDGRLLAAMQGTHEPWVFRTFLTESLDRGKTWRFVSHIASLDKLDDPEGATKRGWTLWGPCEPNVAHAGGGQLVCVARLVNDDHNPLMAAPKERYHDLSYAIPGTGIHPGTLPADAYYEPGPPSAPLIISFSSDTGKTWTPAKPMDQARGCFPRMALGDGVLALTYGGLAYPRWGNCVTFSTDAGKTWSDEVLFAPFFTTGYTDIIATGAKEFVAVFDCTPPQPWKDHAAHWVGAVDIEIV